MPVTVDLLCMGEPMLEFNQLPPGPDGTQHYLEGHGGDTSNAAIAAARQGARVGYITALGQDMPGDSFIRLWQREGVDTATVRRTDRYQTGVYFVTHDAGGHHFLHYRTGSAAAMYAPHDLPEADIAAARMLYVSGISQGISSSACDAVFAAIDIARRHRVTVAYDTNYRPRLWPPARAAAVMHAAMAEADYAMPGEEDVRTLTGLTEPDAMLDFYLRLGARVVLLKMGAAGSYLATAEARTRIPPHPVVAGGCDRGRGHVLRRLPRAHPGGRRAGGGGPLRRRGRGAEMPGLRCGRPDPARRGGVGSAAAGPIAIRARR